jgi:hypothetical protein
MKGKQLIKKIASLLMVAILLMMLLFPALTAPKKSNDLLTIKTILKGLNNSSSEQDKIPASMNMVEEEEEEYMTDNVNELPIQLPVITTISFFFPKVFFNEHFVEVSGPPPWS